MNEKIRSEIDKKIEGSMLISLLNRVYKMNFISNSTYTDLKKQILEEYKINLA